METEIVIDILRLARGLGWSKGVTTASYIAVTRNGARLDFRVNEDGSGNEDGSIDVSHDYGTTFAPVPAMKVALLLV